MSNIDIPDGFNIIEKNDEFIICESEYIKGLLTFQRKLFPDDRGFFQELCRYEEVSKIMGRDFVVRQSSITRNNSGSIRGMHAEPIDKSVAALTGAGMMAWTDIREDSKTFGKSVNYQFDYVNDSDAQRICFIVPAGLANGVMYTKEGLYFYAVSGTYQAGEKRAFRWNDPDANIPWPMQPVHISEDDKAKHPFLKEMFPEKF